MMSRCVNVRWRLNCVRPPAQLAGLSTALRCLREGLHVAVVDRQCARASWADSASGLNCGLLEPLSADLSAPWPSLQVRLLQETSRQIEELHEAGHDLEFCRCGALDVVSNQEQLAHAEEAAAQSRAEGLAVDMLSAQQLRDKEPHALPHLLGAVSMPMAASVNPRKLMLALLAEVSKFQESGDVPPGAGDGGGSGEGGKTRGRLQMFWGHTVAGVRDDASGAGRWSCVSIRPNGGLRASVALLFGRTASSIFGGEVVLRTRATVLAVGPHSQRLAKRLLSTHVPIMPVVGTMLRLEGPKDHAQVLNHILLSHESTLFFEKERAHQDALRLSSYRAMPARRGENSKGGTPFSAHDKELWKTLKEEGKPIPGRPEVFEWRGRVLLQPRQDDVGRLVVVEEGTGEVILRTEGTKPASQGWPGAGRGQTHKMPVDHLERLVCPPGATHAVGALSNQRRTRHLYGKQAADKSLWFGGDRIGAAWWAPWLWRGGVSAPPHSTLSVRQHVSSILKLPEAFVTVRTWQGVMAFSTVQILKRTLTVTFTLYICQSNDL
jgi:hypothetical protein